MKIGVLGLWHLGMTYSICLSDLGHSVIGLDQNQEIVDKLKAGKLPVSEPKLEKILNKNMQNGLLNFSSCPEDVANLDTLFVAYDSPVDENDECDSNWVIDSAFYFLPNVSERTQIVISSQLPVGSSKIFKERLLGCNKQNQVLVNPENLRLGRAWETFFHPDRLVFGTENGSVNPKIESVFKPLDVNIIWIKNESAEMSKHALNTFLAMSISYAGELAELCEIYGADSKEVELALKTDSRIGSRAYLNTGLGFSGGTLARDVKTLCKLQKNIGKEEALIPSIITSNEFNNEWIERQLDFEEIGASSNIVFAGITYVGGTNTLRRSNSYRIMRKARNSGANVSYIEDVDMSDQLEGEFNEYDQQNSEISSIDALVIMRSLDKILEEKKLFLRLIEQAGLILDPARVLPNFFPEIVSDSRYRTVGKGY